MAYPDFLDTLDYNGIIEYLFCHSIYGSKTFFNDIKLLPSNSIFTFQSQSSKKIILKSIKNKKERYQFPKEYNEDIDLEDVPVESLPF